MANLRKTTKNITLHADDDIESPFSSSHEDAVMTTKLIASEYNNQYDTDYSPPLDSSPSKSSSSRTINPIRRKVLSLLVDDPDNQASSQQLLSILRDILLGSVLGLLTISLLVVLDHSDIIHLQSAHNFRNAAFALLNDPETVSYMEENLDMKFVSVGAYNTIRTDTEVAMKEIERLKPLIEERTAELNEKKEVFDTLSKEYNELMSSPLLGLDKFCGTCPWGGGGRASCDERVAYLMNKYGNSLHEAKMGAMKAHESCRNK
ncbi:hypothetical protein ACHAXH_008166 [Discostella pseudostelligera]